jgi:hypothetical protein
MLAVDVTVALPVVRSPLYRQSHTEDLFWLAKKNLPVTLRVLSKLTASPVMPQES